MLQHQQVCLFVCGQVTRGMPVTSILKVNGRSCLNHRCIWCHEIPPPSRAVSCAACQSCHTMEIPQASVLPGSTRVSSLPSAPYECMYYYYIYMIFILLQSLNVFECLNYYDETHHRCFSRSPDVWCTLLYDHNPTKLVPFL